MSTISAALQRLHITSPQPQTLADFYATVYAMPMEKSGDTWRCRAHQRMVEVSAGPANRLRYALFGLETAQAWERLRERLAHAPGAALPAEWGLAPDALAAIDPDGNVIAFEGPERIDAQHDAAPAPAQLQHFALRTQQIEAMVAFYENVLGFVVSDKVVNEQGELRACFLRVNHLHHALALFAAPSAGYDHQSFETPDWDGLKRWADRMGELRQTIVWGVGRHGPGNDAFFMVRDPDGNLAEISAEIESCAEDRPAGRWPHEERTLNLWGKAIMRS